MHAADVHFQSKIPLLQVIFQPLRFIRLSHIWRQYKRVTVIVICCPLTFIQRQWALTRPIQSELHVHYQEQSLWIVKWETFSTCILERILKYTWDTTERIRQRCPFISQEKSACLWEHFGGRCRRSWCIGDGDYVTFFQMRPRVFSGLCLSPPTAYLFKFPRQ